MIEETTTDLMVTNDLTSQSDYDLRLSSENIPMTTLVEPLPTNSKKGLNKKEQRMILMFLFRI